jgi:hypothetical protein
MGSTLPVSYFRKDGRRPLRQFSVTCFWLFIRNLSVLRRKERMGKIKEGHLQRMAYVYVRQSSLAQVQHHQEESTRGGSIVLKNVHYAWDGGKSRLRS